MGMSILSYDNMGQVTVDVNGKKYSYWIDAVHIKHVLDLERYAPFKALNFLKKWCVYYQKEN